MAPKKIATRVAYGETLAQLGEENPKIVVLDADLSGSTKTALFGKKFPERFFNMGVSEQDMMGTAAGLALCGKTVFASSFAMFATGRAFEIVRNSIVYPHLNVKICATHAGLTVGEDGASHQALVDVTVMRALPGMTVIVPADATETRQVIRAITQMDGPVYVRLSRADTPLIFGDEHKFVIGKAQSLTEGKDLTLVACGLMVDHCLQAAKILETQGISCAVINMSTIKPLDEATLLAWAKKTGKVMTVEEHSILGGLGSAVAESLGEIGGFAVHRYGVKDQFGQSGKASDLLKHYKLMPEDIAREAVDFIKRTS
jgi:transketolase